MGLFTIPQVPDSMSKMSNPPIKLTPLHSFFQQRNVQLIEHQGWETPQVYTTREAELEGAQQRAMVVVLGGLCATPHKLQSSLPHPGRRQAQTLGPEPWYRGRDEAVGEGGASGDGGDEGSG